MLISRRVPALIVLLLMAPGLGGCGSISAFLAGGMADLIPAWACGLPPDAPPRPGTPQYDEYMKLRESKPSPATLSGPDPANSPSAQAVH